MDEKREQGVILSKSFKAGKRTYFFDVKETNGGEYYLSLSESKRYFDKNDGSFYYKKHNVFIYKESLMEFQKFLSDTIQFIIENQGIESNRKYNRDYSESEE